MIAALFVETNGVYFGLPNVDWIPADFHGGFTCCVEQGHYGHKARKKTWLYACKTEIPELKWGNSGKKMRIGQGCHSKEERRRLTKTGICQRLSKKQRTATPIEFRDLLISIAKTAHMESGNAGEKTGR
jgi:hypothetical protein